MLKLSLLDPFNLSESWYGIRFCDSGRGIYVMWKGLQLNGRTHVFNLRCKSGKNPHGSAVNSHMGSAVSLVNSEKPELTGKEEEIANCLKLVKAAFAASVQICRRHGQSRATLTMYRQGLIDNFFLHPPSTRCLNAQHKLSPHKKEMRNHVCIIST